MRYWQGAIRDGLSWLFRTPRSTARQAFLLDPEFAVQRCTATDSAVLEKLIARSDVLVENFRPGVMPAMGFDQARPRKQNSVLRLLQYHRVWFDAGCSA